MNFYIIGTILAMLVVGFFVLNHYQKKNIEKLFTEVFEASKQVPKQKKNSFLLLLFKESLSTKKSKQKEQLSKLNNPKYLEIQLLQMSNILKDTSNVKDKKMKQSIRLLEDYLKWEKANKGAKKAA